MSCYLRIFAPLESNDESCLYAQGFHCKQYSVPLAGNGEGVINPPGSTWKSN